MKRFIVEQKITALANQYRVFAGGENNEKGELVSFAHQKRFAFKEEVSFFADEQRANLAFSVKAEKALDFHGKFIVTDPQNNRIGAVRKSFKSSLLRSTWEILDPQDEVQLIIQERSQSMAIFRRIWGLVPYLGDLPFLFKYHFDFIEPSTGNVVGTYYKTTRFRDHYLLEMADDSLAEQVGWQTLVTQAVLLDALQGR